MTRFALTAVPGFILIAGCGGTESTLAPGSGAANDISQLWWSMLAGSVIVFGVVLTLVLWAVLRRRSDEPGARSPRWLGEPLVLVGGAVIPSIVLVALFAATLFVLPKTSPAASSPSPDAAPSDGLEIDVTGRQWFWDVAYPAQQIRTANEIHMPVGDTATLRLRTGDVVHSLWIPALNRKLDMIPGQTNTLLLRPTRVGTYRGQCAEFCGLQHAHMAFDVVVEPRAEFDRWAAGEAKPAPRPATDELERGQQIFLGSACVYCHTIAATNATGRVGPDLTHVASRPSLAAGTIPNNKGYLAGWILDPQHVKPGNRMPATDLTGNDLQPLLAYLKSLR